MADATSSATYTTEKPARAETKTKQGTPSSAYDWIPTVKFASNDIASVKNNSRGDVIISKRGVQMCVPYTVLVGMPAGTQADDWCAIGDFNLKVDTVINRVFKECNDIANCWNANSELSQGLNAAEAGAKVSLSAHLTSLLHTANALASLGPQFDPTVEPLCRLWRERLSQTPPAIPTEEEINREKALVGWADHISLDVDQRTVVKSHSLTRVDLCSLAKGWCVDRMAEQLQSAGFTSCLVEWGGDIRSVGINPLEGRHWECSISCSPSLADLFQSFSVTTNAKGSSLPTLAGLQLKDQNGETALATSGDYAQLKKWGYHHIVDPASGMLLKAGWEAPSTCSVTSNSCQLADAVSTCMMACPTAESALAWLLEAAPKLPGVIHRYWIYSRHDNTLLHGNVAEEMQRLEAGALLRKALRAIPNPVAVIIAATYTKGVRQVHGITVSSCVWCSRTPPMLSFNIDKSSHMHSVLCASRLDDRVNTISVHFLQASQAEVARHFATCTSPEHVEWHWFKVNGTREAPTLKVVEDGATVVYCTRRNLLETGDHHLVVVDVLKVVHNGTDQETDTLMAKSLLYGSRRYVSIGDGSRTGLSNGTPDKAETQERDSPSLVAEVYKHSVKEIDTKPRKRSIFSCCTS
ncbi:hypothetical protein CYMTET_14033 [Cymbomonas tetramitiformis]|uniref:FAD:protein FMN transferase n=1 Tax=Cymbomonas tetramitiformis TaxID=36881 RepID=A0AAE0LAS7_9CHLO|nr:hypothetical protein CYMTET_43989 [Cymbomonas tetramitiformis]KAK3277999.1 hypothetical protein CYMTET_14033 [Cymbomonas tetramitiformis]|eukprot:gene2411-3141_t